VLGRFREPQGGEVMAQRRQEGARPRAFSCQQATASRADCPQATLIFFLRESQLGHSERQFGRRTVHTGQPLSVWEQDSGAIYGHKL